MPSNSSLQVDLEDTLLATFLAAARSATTAENPVLECGEEYWTYAELDIISSGLALQIHEKYGLHPTVAVVSENHPFVLAVLLATWKLGGIFAPLDSHAPLDMVKQMLKNVEATCAVIPAAQRGLSELLQGMDTEAIIFPKDTTIVTLTQRYLDQDAELPAEHFPPPTASSLALYLHTSSASSIFNLKCVPLTHGIVSKGCKSAMDRLRVAWPSVSFDKLRVLSHSPWTHIMAISHDIVGSAFGSAGCIVMGILPSDYPTELDIGESVFGKEEHEMDVLDRLLETALRSQPDMLVGVPWVLEGFKERYEQLVHLKMEPEALRVREMLQKVKCFRIGGAAMTQELLLWIRDMEINVSSNIGMTELGGPLFQTRVDYKHEIEEGWSMDDCAIEDAELVLINDEGEEDNHEGELCITSEWIGRGYLEYDSPAFSLSPDGKVTFKTGDIYRRSEKSRYLWKGRKEDYIQMISSETLDPRPLEKALNSCPAVAHSCVVGNNFMRKPSDVVCVIIQPASPKLKSKELAEITRAVASINKKLLPPLRIAWTRVGILDNGLVIPYTRKRMIFRKKLEEVFGDFLAGLLQKDSNSKLGSTSTQLGTAQLSSLNLRRDENMPVISGTTHSDKDGTTTLVGQAPKRYERGIQWTAEEVTIAVMNTVASVLEVESEVVRINPNISFAEFGMDSNMAVRIVNQLNEIFGLQLPLNACHNLVDFAMLLEAVLVKCGLKEGSKITLAQSMNTISPIEEDVVIVGQAVRLPGDINTPASFWDALISKRKDIMAPIPADRWDHASFYRPPSSTNPSKTCDIIFEKAGFVDVAHFDNSFFGISAPEALYISPSTRLTLETVFEAFENACIPVSKMKGSKMGVFVAANLDEGYTNILYQEKGFDAYTRYYGTGVATSTIAGRISYLFDAHGPSSVIDTACSSGLVALHQAVKYIQSGDGESAVVTAVNTRLWPGSFGFLSAQKMASPNSRCATFTNEADGYVPSEASISFILKSKSAAVRDRDAILAVIKSTDVMHGGRTQGLVAPSVSTQIALQESLLQKAGMNASQIDFLETHGTGTALGDLIEIQGINEVFHDSHTAHPLILGAAKTCIGHTEVAAGLVGLLKAIGTVQNGEVPGLVHLTPNNINPSINYAIVPISIPNETASLPRRQSNDPYRGLVLSNGFAGTMAGVIVEEPKGLHPNLPQIVGENEENGHVLMPFVLSAKTVDALEDYLKKYLAFCRKAKAADFRDICYTSCVGREHFRYRYACAVTDLKGLIIALEECLRSFPSQNYKNIGADRIAFAYPGQGSQYQGMASCLAEFYPTFKDLLAFHGSTAAKLSGFPILSFLLDRQPPSHYTVEDGQISQICIYVYQYSISMWIKTLGLEPCAVIGHSLGEITAAAIAGAMSYELGLELVIKRAKLFSMNTTTPGGMAIIAALEKDISQLIHHLGFNGRVVIAVYNGPQSHVISGELSCVETLLSNAQIQGFRATRLDVTQGFHSPLIHSSLPALQEWVMEHQPYFLRLKIPLYSTVCGSEITSNSCLRPSYWIEHARDPVRFSDAIEAMASNNSIDVILDVGPQPFLWTAMQTMPSAKLTLALSAKHTSDQHRAFLGAILSLFKHGSNVNFEKLLSRSPLQGKRMPLPTYPFQRQRHYPDYIPSRKSSIPISRFTTAPSESFKRLVQFNVDQVFHDMLFDHQVEGHRVAPGASLVDFFATRSGSRSVQSITFHSPLVISSPHLEVCGEIDSDGRFFLYEGASKTNQICSGTLSPKASTIFTPRGSGSDDSPPDYVKAHAEVYESHRAVHLGPSFRNIQNIRVWPTHADILIEVSSTEYPVYDRIRKIDCCLHAFGALVQREVPQSRDLQQGSFLPASLEDFTLYSDDLPESFVCRYYLPCDVERNYRVMSIAFEAFSLSGALLITCRKYSVAWIPTGVVVQDKARSSPLSESIDCSWLQQHWVSQDMPSAAEGFVAKYDQILYISAHDHNSKVGRILFDFTDEVIPVLLREERSGLDVVKPPSKLDTEIERSLQRMKGSSTLVMFDLTSTESLPTSDAFVFIYRLVLSSMKALSKRTIDISNFIIVSEMSVPMHVEAMTRVSGEDPTQFPSVGALVQGMFRVFRSEMGLDSQLWALDLPPIDSMNHSTLREVLHQELLGRQSAPSRSSLIDRTVAYRTGRDAGVERFIPILRPTGGDFRLGTTGACTGVTLIVGMGSIGAALANALTLNGCSQIIFVGRRAAEDREIMITLGRLNTETNGKVSYFQTDVCDLEALRSRFVDIISRYGPVDNIIHTAAVISDARIPTVEIESFERVLRPKVAGAWNLHLVSQGLCPTLKTFTLLSSISVSLGNQGQVSYVAGNSFMEVLAAHRLANGLPATALQLGPWQSKLTDSLHVPNTLVHIMNNEIGIPLILKAMFKREAVQIIANLNTKRLAEVSVYAQDSLYQEVSLSAPTRTSGRHLHTKQEASAIVIRILGDVLELTSPAQLELTDSLTSCGIDSIAFAQIRGKVVNDLDVEVPNMFLSDTFTIQDMIDHVVNHLSSS